MEKDGEHKGNRRLFVFLGRLNKSLSAEFFAQRARAECW
jgi:hypothetical protein